MGLGRHISIFFWFFRYVAEWLHKHTCINGVGDTVSIKRRPIVLFQISYYKFQLNQLINVHCKFTSTSLSLYRAQWSLQWAYTSLFMHYLLPFQLTCHYTAKSSDLAIGRLAIGYLSLSMCRFLSVCRSLSSSLSFSAQVSKRKMITILLLLMLIMTLYS